MEHEEFEQEGLQYVEENLDATESAPEALEDGLDIFEGLSEEEKLRLRAIRAEATRNILTIKNKQEYYKTVFNSILLELFDMQSSWEVTKTNYTEALLNQGVTVDPKELYSFMDMATRRMAKLHVMKHLALSFGLVDMYDKIMEKEIGLIYTDSRPWNKDLNPNNNRAHHSSSGQDIDPTRMGTGKKK